MPTCICQSSVDTGLVAHRWLVRDLATTYEDLGRLDEGLRLRQDAYSGILKLLGNEQRGTLLEAINYATSLVLLVHFEEAKSLLCKTIPVARRVLGENTSLTLRMKWLYALALYRDEGATLDDLRKAVETLETVEPLWKRIFGEAHPETPRVQGTLKEARRFLAARAAASSSSAA